MAGETVDGGKPMKKDVMGYQPPAGPIGIMSTSNKGLGGDNTGCGEDGPAAGETGTPGNHGTNHGCCGSQGRY